MLPGLMAKETALRNGLASMKPGSRPRVVSRGPRGSTSCMARCVGDAEENVRVPFWTASGFGLLISATVYRV